MRVYDQAYQVGTTGTTVTSGASTANVAIPVNANGDIPKYVRLMVTGNLYVKAGQSSVTATTNDMLLSPNFDVILNVHGCSKIAYIQETASAKLNITALES